jgi:DNA-binding NarL/FixJ family response regulator
VTGRDARHRLVLTDDGIIDPVAVETAARGIRLVALTRTERQFAAARILARGGTPYLIATRLHVSGTTARTLADRAAGGQR